MTTAKKRTVKKLDQGRKGDERRRGERVKGQE